jgi:hypothetical protein
VAFTASTIYGRPFNTIEMSARSRKWADIQDEEDEGERKASGAPAAAAAAAAAAPAAMSKVDVRFINYIGYTVPNYLGTTQSVRVNVPVNTVHNTKRSFQFAIYHAKQLEARLTPDYRAHVTRNINSLQSIDTRLYPLVRKFDFNEGEAYDYLPPTVRNGQMLLPAWQAMPSTRNILESVDHWINARGIVQSVASVLFVDINPRYGASSAAFAIAAKRMNDLRKEDDPHKCKVLVFETDETKPYASVLTEGKGWTYHLSIDALLAEAEAGNFDHVFVYQTVDWNSELAVLDSDNTRPHAYTASRKIAQHMLSVLEQSRFRPRPQSVALAYNFPPPPMQTEYDARRAVVQNAQEQAILRFITIAAAEMHQDEKQGTTSRIPITCISSPLLPTRTKPAARGLPPYTSVATRMPIRDSLLSDLVDGLSNADFKPPNDVMLTDYHRMYMQRGPPFMLSFHNALHITRNAFAMLGNNKSAIAVCVRNCGLPFVHATAESFEHLVLDRLAVRDIKDNGKRIHLDDNLQHNEAVWAHMVLGSRSVAVASPADILEVKREMSADGSYFLHEVSIGRRVRFAGKHVSQTLGEPFAMDIKFVKNRRTTVESLFRAALQMDNERARALPLYAHIPFGIGTSPVRRHLAHEMMTANLNSIARSLAGSAQRVVLTTATYNMPTIRTTYSVEEYFRARYPDWQVDEKANVRLSPAVAEQRKKKTIRSPEFADAFEKAASRRQQSTHYASDADDMRALLLALTRAGQPASDWTVMLQPYGRLTIFYITLNVVPRAIARNVDVRPFRTWTQTTLGANKNLEIF